MELELRKLPYSRNLLKLPTFMAAAAKKGLHPAPVSCNGQACMSLNLNMGVRVRGDYFDFGIGVMDAVPWPKPSLAAISPSLAAKMAQGQVRRVGWICVHFSTFEYSHENSWGLFGFWNWSHGSHQAAEI